MSSADENDSLMANNCDNVRYYQMLLENNYITDLSNAQQTNNILQMEHSYSRDWRPMEGAHVMTTRTIMVHRPPPCPSCHVHSHDDLGIDMGDTYNPPIPSYNEESAKNSMEECERMAISYRNLSLPTSSNSVSAAAAAAAAVAINTGASITDDQDWEETVNKFGWSKQQDALFTGVAHILDLDHLARLANKERQHEPVLRRGVIDKSVARMRKLFSKYAWDIKLTQWLHNLLMDQLSPSYLASYLDILQTMKSKIPELVDKMMSNVTTTNTNNTSAPTVAAAAQDLLATIMKKPWEPNVIQKNRKLPGQAIIVIVPTSPMMDSNQSARMQRWYNLFTSMGHVVSVKMNLTGAVLEKQSFQTVTEHMIALSRAKIQEVRNEQPTRQIILVGFNAGAALAIQIAIVEPVNSVVCMGFAYNTLNGVRGSPDDRILSLVTPVLFVLGQNAARSSQEEIESLREKMQAQTSLVVVGSADDVLRVGKTKRQIEGVTQTMVDNMIMDEISEFASTCIINPPAPRDLAAENTPVSKLVNGPAAVSGARGTSIATSSADIPVNNNRTATGSGSGGGAGTGSSKKRKISQNGLDTDMNLPPPKTKASKTTDGGQDGKPVVPRKVGRPRLTQTSAKKDVTVSAATATGATAPIPLTQITPLAVPAAGKLSLIQPTGEVLNAAIQSILTTTTSLSDTKNITTPSATLQEEIISSYEVLPNMDLKPLTTTTKSPITIQTITKKPPPLSIRQTKTKNTQQNSHFVKLKPPGIGANKMFPIKSLPTNVTPPQHQRTSSTMLGVDNKAFTIKSTPTGTQLLSTTTTTTTPLSKKSSLQITPKSKMMGPMINISPPKFTVYKSPALQQQPQIKRVSQILKLSSNSTQKTVSPDLSSTNIFDMPIVFADNDGNIHENSGNNSTLSTQPPSALTSSSTFTTITPLSSSATTTTTPPTIINANTPVILSSVSSVSVVGSGSVSGNTNSHQGFQIQSIQTSSATGTRLPNRNIIINAIGPNKTATIGGVSGNNKVLLINRGPMKGQQVQVTGVSNILSNLQTASTTIGGGNTIVTPGGQTVVVTSATSSASTSATSNQNIIPTLVKYTKVNVSNANTIRTVGSIGGGNIEFRAAGQITTPTTQTTTTITPQTITNSSGTFKSFPLGSKVEIFNNTIIKSSSGISGSSTNTKTITTSGFNKFPPTIMMNIDPKNMVKVSSPNVGGVTGNITTISDVKLKPTNTILIKSGGLRQIPIMNQGILNRNVTLRKLVNVNLVGQPTKLVSGTGGGVGVSGTTILTSTGQIKVTPTTTSTTKSITLPQQLLVSSSTSGSGTTGGIVTVTQPGTGTEKK